jgi:hypothetical protein
MKSSWSGVAGERTELLRMLAELRHNLLITVRGIDEGAAARRTTVSELTLGWIIAHLTQGERVWSYILGERGGTPDLMWDFDQYRFPEGATLAAFSCHRELLHCHPEPAKDLSSNARAAWEILRKDDGVARAPLQSCKP